MSSAGQIVGGAVGFFLGGPLGIGAAMGAQAGIMLGGLIDPPKQPTIHGPRLNDLSVQTSTTDAPIPRIYGTMATFGNIIWVEGDRLKESVKKTKSGGKGGGGQTTKTYSYSATFAVGLCKGPIAGVRRIWVGAKLIYDAGSSDLEAIIASNQAASGFKIYLGDETQLPNPRMQADKGVANTPGYRGLAYIVFYDLGLAEYGNSLMGAQVKVEVVNYQQEVWNGHIITSPVGFSTHPPFDTMNPFFHAPTINQWAYIKGQAAICMECNFLNNNYYINFYRLLDSFFYQRVNAEMHFVSNTNAAVLPGRSLIAPRFLLRRGGFLSKFMLIDIDGTFVEYDTGYTLPWNVFTWVQDFNGAVFIIPTGVEPNITKIVGDTVTASYLIPDAPRASDADIYGTHIYVLSGEDLNQSMRVVKLTTATLEPVSEFVFATPGVSGNNYRKINVVGEDVFYIGSRGHAGSLSFSVVKYDNGSVTTKFVNASTSLNNNYDFSVETDIVLQGREGSGATPHAYVVGRTASNSATSLSSIIQSETLQSKLILEQDINTTSLTDQVRGYRVATPSAIRADIEPLQLAWPFDVVQRGYKLHFIRRPKTNAATVTEIIGKFQVDREMDIQLLREVALKYVEADREYDVSQQIAKRENTDAINRKDIDLPIVMTASEALQKAEILLYMWWLERYDLTFKLPPIYNNLEASDVITINTEFGTYEVRLTEVTYNADGTLDCKAKYNSANVYTSDAVADTGTSQGSSLQLSGPTLYQVVDMPLVADALDGPGMFMMASGYTTGWPGGTVIRSSDNGATWDEIQGFTQPCAMGFARGTIGAATSAIVDTTSSLQVDMVTGQLESVDHLQLLAGANAFAYGADGRWEIIFAQNCVLQGDGSYILTNFLRGRAGTERNMANHAAGDALISLTDPDIAFVPMNTAQIGISKLYRGITIGRTIDTDTDKALTYHGVNLKPLAPVYLNGHRHPSTNDWTLTWIRRGRVSPEWRDLVDVPVGEATQAFEIEVWNAAYTTLYRTLTAATPTVNYTSAQQVTDFGSNQSTLHVRIFQMSASVGRGFPLQTSITR